MALVAALSAVPRVNSIRGDGSSGFSIDSVPLFSGLPKLDLAAVSAVAHTKSYARGELIHVKGDPVQRVILVVSGYVKQSQLSSGGLEVILRLGVPGDVVGATSLLGNGFQQTNAQAFRACRTLTWESKAFKGFVDRFPVLHQNMIKLMGQDLNELEERFREVATEKVGLRVAKQLVRLGEAMGRLVEGGIEISLSREELGQMTGTTLFTVSRLFSAWEAIGMLTPGRESVRIRDLDVLRSVCD